MSKWEPVNPADLKPGDKFKAVAAVTNEEFIGTIGRLIGAGCVSKDGWLLPFRRGDKWFRRKPAKPTRPAEPPAGTVVRNTTEKWIGMRDDDHWWYVHSYDGQFVSSYNWDDWIAPGDEIQIAEWVKP